MFFSNHLGQKPHSHWPSPHQPIGSLSAHVRSVTANRPMRRWSDQSVTFIDHAADWNCCMWCHLRQDLNSGWVSWHLRKNNLAWEDAVIAELHGDTIEIHWDRDSIGKRAKGWVVLELWWIITLFTSGTNRFFGLLHKRGKRRRWFLRKLCHWLGSTSSKLLGWRGQWFLWLRLGWWLSLRHVWSKNKMQ